MKKRLIIFLLVLHLLVIYMGTSLFSFGMLPVRMQLAAMYYLSLVGGHPYSFFSPDIPTETVVSCRVTDQEGRVHEEILGESRNTFELRTTYTMQLLSDNHDYETMAKLANEYYAAKYPKAKRIEVSIGKYVTPAIEEYKTGKRATISELYSETFPHE